MIKKSIVIISAAVAIAVSACNSDSGKEGEKSATGDKKEAAASGPSDSPDYAPGLAVVGKSDCNTCHRLDERLQGPSLKEIARRYADSSRSEIVPKLAQKIIDGGIGNWGNEIPMTPHPGLTQEEAEAAVKYVLLFKN